MNKKQKDWIPSLLHSLEYWKDFDTLPIHIKQHLNKIDGFKADIGSYRYAVHNMDNSVFSVVRWIRKDE